MRYNEDNERDKNRPKPPLFRSKTYICSPGVHYGAVRRTSAAPWHALLTDGRGKRRWGAPYSSATPQYPNAVSA